MKVAVVGAGLGGLSAACHLAGQGHEVTVLERGDGPGGRAGVYRAGGYRLDNGPTVLTMAGILSDVFAAAGASMDRYLELNALDPMYRACFAADGDPEGGGTIYVRRGRQAMAAEISATCGATQARAFARFCDWLERLYSLEMPNFIDRNFDSALDLARPLGPILALARTGALRKLDAVVSGYFSDPRLRKLFGFQAMYAGLSPFSALAVYCVITYMDTVEGVWFPTGGMNSVAQGLARAAADAGVEFCYSTPVESIARRPGKNGRVTGVRTEAGELIRADAIVANPDLPMVYRQLLDGVPAPRAARNGHYSPSCVVWLAGTKGPLPAGVAHHNIHFGQEWRTSFDSLLKRGEPMADPSYLVSLPSLSDPDLAPAGGHCIYALEPVPNLDGTVNWDTESDHLCRRLVERVAERGYPSDIQVEHFIDPREWRRQGMERGTPFALSHRFFQTGPFRPGNVDDRVPGLVLVGSGTQPGVGIPMVLLSGRLAAERVARLAGAWR